MLWLWLKESCMRKTVIFMPILFGFNTCAETSSAGFLWWIPLKQVNSRSFLVCGAECIKIPPDGWESDAVFGHKSIVISHEWTAMFFWHLLPSLQPWLMAADTGRISALVESPWRCVFSHCDCAGKFEGIMQVCSETSHTNRKISVAEIGLQEFLSSIPFFYSIPRRFSVIHTLHLQSCPRTMNLSISLSLIKPSPWVSA